MGAEVTSHTKCVLKMTPLVLNCSAGRGDHPSLKFSNTHGQDKMGQNDFKVLVLYDMRPCYFASIFGYHDNDADDIIYINWLNMVRAGLMGLEYYTPEANNWRQVCTYKYTINW